MMNNSVLYYVLSRTEMFCQAYLLDTFSIFSWYFIEQIDKSQE